MQDVEQIIIVNVDLDFSVERLSKVFIYNAISNQNGEDLVPQDFKDKSIRVTP